MGRNQVAVVSFAVTVAADVDNVTVMQEPVDQHATGDVFPRNTPAFSVRRAEMKLRNRLAYSAEANVSRCS